jgi:hypothetical protein
METCSILDSDVTPVKLPTAPGNMGSAVVSGMKVNTNLNSNTKPEISTEKGAYSGKGKELEKHETNREATAKEVTVAVVEQGFFPRDVRSSS